jgi:hypothetical protein
MAGLRPLLGRRRRFGALPQTSATGTPSSHPVSGVRGRRSDRAGARRTTASLGCRRHPPTPVESPYRETLPYGSCRRSGRRRGDDATGRITGARLYLHSYVDLQDEQDILARAVERMKEHA